MVPSLVEGRWNGWTEASAGPAVDPDLGAEQLAELHQIQSGHYAGFGRQGPRHA